MLEKILFISGKSGLYKMLSSNKKMIIVESLADQKRVPVYTNEKVMSLNDISIYTEDEDVPLRDVFTAIFKKENGKTVELDKNADSVKLQGFLAEYLPQFDKERVHNSDIKKIAQWYNILVQAGFTSFEEDSQNEDEKAEEAEQTKAEEVKTSESTTKAKADAKAEKTDADETAKPAAKAKKTAKK